ncbi:alcohol dehydrogenase catalytic domain-containing protein [Streptomyces sp. NPDC057367]|uniref:alcohol dehydrogenase catalytic domain-containing protein n=1 Tax=Streptomyces sp. NPDC057367 TaxID=3346108 RepID=UPI003629EC6D
MRAVQVVRYGDHPLDNVRMAEVPAPEVSGPHDVIVRIGGAGVRRTDPHIPEGQWAEQSGVCRPYAIGHENAGWAHAVGSAVTSGAEGDKVIVHPLMACRAGGDVHCEQSLFPGIDTAGGYAEYLRTTARSVVRLDDSLEPADVAGSGPATGARSSARAASATSASRCSRPSPSSSSSSTSRLGRCHPRRRRHAAPARRLPPGRVRREHRRPDDRRHFVRDQLHR